MHVRNQMRIACSALLIALGSTGVAAAQSLSLSYDVNVRRDGVERVLLPSDPCSGSDWSSSVVACTPADAASSSSQEDGTARGAGLRRVVVGAGAHAVPTPVPRQAFQAGDESLDPRLRGASSSRAADVSLRLGSKNRPLSSEEGREQPRFVDAAYENYVHSNAHKALALELLVPFQ